MKKILHRPMFYLNSWLEARRDEYIDHLRPLGVQEGAWNRWIAFFLNGLEEQARLNASKARRILELYERMKEKVLQLTHSQYAVPLLDQMFERPVFEAGQLKLVEKPPTRAAVFHLIRTLREAGILKVIREGGGRRSTIYAFGELINLCDGRQILK